MVILTESGGRLFAGLQQKRIFEVYSLRGSMIEICSIGNWLSGLRI